MSGGYTRFLYVYDECMIRHNINWQDFQTGRRIASERALLLIHLMLWKHLENIIYPRHERVVR